VNTLLIVDDHEGFRSFVASMLDGDEFTVTGIAEDGETALEAVASLRPDLVLLDIQLPGIDGFEVASRISRTPSPPAIVLTSTRDAADFGARLRSAPVLGFVPKHEMAVGAISDLLARTGHDRPS
jgi:CheY-like chemotaxis protein